MIGTITGRRIATNRDGNKDVRLLQVEIIQDVDIQDVRTVEIYCPMDYNPANGTQVDVITVSGGYQIAIGFSDGLTPEVDPGEYEIYSTDNPVTMKKARIKLNKDGEIIMNSGTDFGVAFNELKTAFDQLKLDFDLHTHSVPGITAGPAAATTLVTVPSTANIDPAKVDEVRI